MRENRTYGSEGGEAGQPAFPTPIIAPECVEITKQLGGSANVTEDTDRTFRATDGSGATSGTPAVVLTSFPSAMGKALSGIRTSQFCQPPRTHAREQRSGADACYLGAVLSY